MAYCFGKRGCPSGDSHSPRKERRTRALELLEKYGLQGFEHSYPSELSGGMQQRVLLIRTLIYQPDVVLLDEPLSRWDAQTRVLLQDEFLRLWRDTGRTFVLVTHDLEEAIVLSQRVFLLGARPGRLVQEFPVSLPSDRSAKTIRTDPQFQAIQREMWAALTTQVLQQSGDGSIFIHIWVTLQEAIASTSPPIAAGVTLGILLFYSYTTSQVALVNSSTRNSSPALATTAREL